MKWIWTWTSSSTAPSSLYENADFKVVQTFSSSEEDDETFCIMRKKLD